MPELTEELKPCPFCGGTDLFIPEYEKCLGAMRIKCRNRECRAIGPRYYEKGKTAYILEEAIKAWNRRETSPRASDIMPCPFCGSRGVICYLENGSLRCPSCEALLIPADGILKSWKFAVNAWNKRKGIQILPEIEYINPYRWKER